MILITGGTGFIGQALVRHLAALGHPVRMLIRPSLKSPELPRGVPVEVAVSSLVDARSLSAALVGVETVFHLAGGEWAGPRADLLEIDILGTQAVAQAAAEAGVRRFFYLSHLGAERGSAFPVLKAKAIAEEHIRRSGVPYTILRSALAFGTNDHFTTGLVQILYALPFIYLAPGDGRTLLQPIWVEDLATCLTWAMDDPETANQTYEVGGPEYLSFAQVAETLLEALGLRRQMVAVRPPYLRTLTMYLENLLPGLPLSVYWLDYLAANRIAGLDTVPRVFKLMPARFGQRLAYLRGPHWRRMLLRNLLRRRRLGGRRKS
jgi:NADH dehydrogenase